MRKYVIGVFGSAAGKIDEKVIGLARAVGALIAEKDCITLTGGCPGYPYEAILGAKEAGGFTVGISPATSRYDHINRFKFPTESFDLLVYAGNGKKGRNVVSLYTADAAIAIAGRIGTLNELTIAYDENRPIGILDVPGLAKEFKSLAENCGKSGAPIILDVDPRKVVDGLLKILNKR
jgi:hypothetical protein